jgi:site-specific recombinase XerC
MNTTDFARDLTQFLGQYLPVQRNVSPHTVRAYRDTFTLLLRYCRDVRGALLIKYRQGTIPFCHQQHDSLFEHFCALAITLTLAPQSCKEMAEQTIVPLNRKGFRF